MQRRSLLLLTPLLPLSLSISRYFKLWASEPRQPIDYREQAQKLDQLASGIQSPADARTFVDFVASIFSEQLPPALVSSIMRERVAQAEFTTVSNPRKLIPEWRVVEAWNIYVQTIEAPRECQIIDAEMHNLRDSFLTTTRLFWQSGQRNIWSVSAIYATQADGGIATGCRAIEAIRILWDLANMPDNLASTRVRVSQGVLTSDLFRQALEHPSTTTNGGRVSAGPATPNPVEIAQRRYIAKNGKKAFGKALAAMLNQALV